MKKITLRRQAEESVNKRSIVSHDFGFHRGPNECRVQCGESYTADLMLNEIIKADTVPH